MKNKASTVLIHVSVLLSFANLLSSATVECVNLSFTKVLTKE